MNRTAAVVRMHFNRRFAAFWMPPILGLGRGRHHDRGCCDHGGGRCPHVES